VATDVEGGNLDEKDVKPAKKETVAFRFLLEFAVILYNSAANAIQVSALSTDDLSIPYK